MTKEKILKLATQIKPVKGHRYLKIDDISISRLDVANRSRIRTPRLKKLGTFMVNIPCSYSQVYRPFSKDIVEQVPEAFVKAGAIAFKLKTKRMEIKGSDILEDVPAKVSVYALKRGAKIPEAIKNQDVVFAGERYTAQEIDRM